MNRIKSALKAVGMTPWFVKTSWSYITTNRLDSKVEFFTGFIHAWFKFKVAT